MMNEVNSNVEKSTFGDLSVLSALKEQMDTDPAAEAKSEGGDLVAKPECFDIVDWNTFDFDRWWDLDADLAASGLTAESPKPSAVKVARPAFPGASVVYNSSGQYFIVDEAIEEEQQQDEQDEQGEHGDETNDPIVSSCSLRRVLDEGERG